MNDPYQTLGVSRAATASEIKQAYRKLAQELHPDRNPDPSAEERFKQVTHAYDVLSDPAKRKRYDEFGEAGLREGFDPDAHRQYQQWGGRAVDLEELLRGSGFGDLFQNRRGGRRSRNPRGRQRGADLRAQVVVTFEESLQGTEKELRFERAKNPTLRCRIPKGVRDGETIRLRGQGERPRRGDPGDLLLDVKVEPHRLFRREGEDLHVTLPLTLREAVEGAKIRVPTPDGPVTLTVPKETESGSILRLRGRGVPRKGSRGDLLVQLQIALPRPSSELGTLLEKLDAHYANLREDED